MKQGADGGRLQPLHPWVGGDYNPLMHIDVCPWATSTTTRVCPCTCQPHWACVGGRNTTEEFPSSQSCAYQARSHSAY